MFLTNEQKKSWLTKNFNEVAIAKNEAGKIVSELPLLFDTHDERFSSVKDFFRRRLGRRSKCFIDAIQGIGSNEEESISALFAAVMGHSENIRNACLYHPKPGQDQSIIKRGDLYELVYLEDPLHDHESIALIDFEIIGIDPLELEVYRGDYEDEHMHLLAH